MRKIHIVDCRFLLSQAFRDIPEIVAALRADDRTLESGYDYAKAISIAPYSGLNGLEAVRGSLLDSTAQLKNGDLQKFVDDRFIRTN